LRGSICSALACRGRVGRAPDDGREWVFPISDCQPLQAQGPASPVDFPAFRRPPLHQAVHGGEVPVDRAPLAAGLAVDAGAAEPFQVLAQGRRGVRDGKTTLTYHLAHALAELGKRTLIIDLDPQCNLTIFSLFEDHIYEIWRKEDNYVDDF